MHSYDINFDLVHTFRLLALISAEHAGLADCISRNRAYFIGKLKCHDPAVARAVPIFFWIRVLTQVAGELLLLEQNVTRRGNGGFIYKLGWELGIQIDPLMEIKTTAPFIRMSFIRGHNALTNNGIRGRDSIQKTNLNPPYF